MEQTNQETQTTPTPPATVTSQENALTEILAGVPAATTMAEWDSAVAIIRKAATDLVASDVVKEGYLAHGHPAELGFIHLNSMTKARMHKYFPLYVPSEPLFAMLYAKGEYIVGQGLVKKYEARKKGKTFDHIKWINRRFEELVNSIEQYRERLREIAYARNNQ